MRRKWPPYHLDGEGELIAGQGDAKLIKRPDGEYELRGGPESDRDNLKEWISRLMKGAKIRGLD